MLVLNRSEVERLLDLDELLGAVSGAMEELSAGRADMAPRGAVSVPGESAMVASMLSYVPSEGALAAKLVSLFPNNPALGLERHQALIVVMDVTTGQAAAVMDGAHITAARTASGSALATKLLARPDARSLAILGTGVQAWAHLLAVTRVAPIEEVWVAGRSPNKVEAFVAKAQKELDLQVRAADGFSGALEHADIACATTHSAEPVVRRRWLHDGMHINSVGVNWEGREVDAETVRDAVVFVESRAAALAQPPALGANDLLWPIRDGIITSDHIRGEVGELLLGRARGRDSAQEITLYKSVGVAVQDAAAAALVLRRARQEVAGVELEL